MCDENQGSLQNNVGNLEYEINMLGVGKYTLFMMMTTMLMMAMMMTMMVTLTMTTMMTTMMTAAMATTMMVIMAISKTMVHVSASKYAPVRNLLR